LTDDLKAEQVRSFISIELPEETKLGLDQLQNALKGPLQSCAKWVNPESIHLTLKFLGNIELSQINSIAAAMQDTTRSFEGFRLQISGLGAFPNVTRVRVIWVGIQGDLEKLIKLQKLLDFNLAKLGYLPEKRAFVPHLTLARVRDYASPAERLALGELVSSIKNHSVFNIEINSLSLMRSQLTPKGAIYSKLRSIRLKTACE
jgi:RNA 2',3'-cyclic 3'-phosphodiesterase